MNNEQEIIKHNPDKSISRVTINSTMMSGLFFILTLVMTLGPQKFNIYVIAQLVLAIPLLFISSLAYAKVGYRKEHYLFDKLAWLTTTVGNNFILNVAGLMTATFYKNLSILYFGIVTLLITVYYIINIYYKRESLSEELLKLIIIFIILFLGGILPLISM